MGDCAPVIVTLTTYFGLQDSYAGQLRGAVLKGCPRATVIDLTHGIPPGTRLPSQSPFAPVSVTSLPVASTWWWSTRALAPLGRDLMAPVAAALAAGRPLTDFGPAVDPAALTLISLPNVAVTDNCLRGQVQRLDHFGNVVTSLHAGGGPFSPERFDSVEIGGRRIAQLRRSYAEVAPCEMLALIGSDDYLEIAVNQGSAAEQLGCRPGDPVIVHLTRT